MIGVDIVKISRIAELIAKQGDRFLQRIFTRAEIEAANKYGDEHKRISYYAKRFAAKEAVAKAIGTGIGEHLAFTDIEISNLPNGQPVVRVKGHADKQFSISLSDEDDYAVGFVIVT